jgi:hypothetical protein
LSGLKGLEELRLECVQPFWLPSLLKLIVFTQLHNLSCCGKVLLLANKPVSSPAQNVIGSQCRVPAQKCSIMLVHNSGQGATNTSMLFKITAALPGAPLTATGAEAPTKAPAIAGQPARLAGTDAPWLIDSYWLHCLLHLQAPLSAGYASGSRGICGQFPIPELYSCCLNDFKTWPAVGCALLRRLLLDGLVSVWERIKEKMSCAAVRA